MLYLHDVVLYTYKRGMGKSYYASPRKVNAIHYFHDSDAGHDGGWSIALIRWCRIIRNSVVCLIGQMKNATAYWVTARHPAHMSSCALYHPPILFFASLNLLASLCLQCLFREWNHGWVTQQAMMIRANIMKIKKTLHYESGVIILMIYGIVFFFGVTGSHWVMMASVYRILNWQSSVP